jgi:hypothetical protein
VVPVAGRRRRWRERLEGVDDFAPVARLTIRALAVNLVKNK